MYSGKVIYKTVMKANGRFNFQHLLSPMSLPLSCLGTSENSIMETSHEGKWKIQLPAPVVSNEPSIIIF